MSAVETAISPQQPLAVGQRVMWFEVEEVLSSDAFGITYRARNTQTDGEARGEFAPVVAIRELLPHELTVRGDFSEVRVADPAAATLFADARARFVSEAKTLAALNHPAIMRVHFHRRINATAYMVMEYLSGQSLRHWLEGESGLSEAQLLACFDPVIDGLREAHRRGLLHANVNPQSIWVRDDNRFVLTGFGAAQLAYLRALREPLSGLAPGYAAIEQYTEDSGHQGTWTDVYGLAAAMYRVVTGYRPADALERLAAVSDGNSDPQHSAKDLGAGRYSEALLAAIDDALALDLERRPKDMEALKTRLHGSAAPAPGVRSSARTHDDVLFGTTPTSDVPLPAVSAPVRATRTPHEVPLQSGFDGEPPSAVPDTLVASAPDVMGAVTEYGDEPTTVMSAQGPSRQRGKPRLAGLGQSASRVSMTLLDLTQHSVARAKRFLGQSAIAAAANGRVLWTRLASVASAAFHTISDRSGRLFARLTSTRAPAPRLSSGSQAIRMPASSPAMRSVRTAGEHLRASIQRLEQTVGLSAARMVGVVVAGTAAVVAVAALVMTLLPGEAPPTVANVPQSGAVTAATPDLAARHYARAARLLMEAAQAKASGDLEKARYLAQTALSIRPGFTDARAFLDAL